MNFRIKGRTMPIQYLLVEKDIDYDMEFVEPEDWLEFREELIFGRLPCLKDSSNDLELAESGAIMRYLARKHGLDGTDDVEKAQIDMVFCAAYDIFEQLVDTVYAGTMYRGGTNLDYSEEKEKFLGKTLPHSLPFFEKLLKHNNEGKDFMVGTKVTYCDYFMLDLLINLNDFAPDCLDDYPLLSAYMQRMASRDKIKKLRESDEMRSMSVTFSGRL